MVETFLTFEDELRRLATLTETPLPPLTQGAWDFFSQLGPWLGKPKADILLPDPNLNLSLPYPREEIALALALGNGSLHSEGEIEAHARATGLASALLDQPTLSLSGGEKMLLSLSKFAALARPSLNVIVCSPYFWLDESNQSRVFSLLETFASRSARTHLLLLEGELPSPPGSVESEADWEIGIDPLEWQLRVDSADVFYPPQTFPRRAPGRRILFESQGQPLILQSPTLLLGSNGVGKTTLAKALAGLLEPEEGVAKAVASGFSGRARLLLQDPLVHLFSLDPYRHLLRIFAYDAERRNQALELYRQLEDEVASQLSLHLPGIPVGGRDEKSSILQTKVALSVERLITPTPLLVIDEPAWCLSRPLARLFVGTVAQAAHLMGTAVLLISHQRSWWTGVVRSEVLLERVSSERVQILKLGE